MSGKFLNKRYVNTIDSLKKNTIDRVKNSNYIFNDSPPIIGIWFNMNKDATTFDEGTGAEYSPLGTHSPIRYNKIINAVVYGRGIRIETEMDYGDNGLELSSQPSFSGTVLPNTWIPYAGDYFVFKHGATEYIYKIVEVTFDTIDNGNNMYRFSASLDSVGLDQIESQVVENYRMIITNVGTSFSPIIKEESFFTIESMEEILTKLKNYFIDLFYDDTVQTFILSNWAGKLYDSELIEFLDTNKILVGAKEDIYINHELPVPRTFEIQYDKSIFKALEKKNKDNFIATNYYGKGIDNQFTLFITSPDAYFEATPGVGLYTFTKISPELTARVMENDLVESIADPHAYYNIIINYFNEHELINAEAVNIIENIDFTPTMDLFYGIPMIIYIMEDNIKNLMKKTY